MVKFTSSAVAALILGVSSYNGVEAFAPMKSQASVSALKMVRTSFAISGIILNSLEFSFHLEVKIFGIRRFHEESFSRFPISFNFQ